VLADDGSILSCAVNAMQLALIDAGIPMQGLVASVTCCLDVDSNLVLDPVQAEVDCAQSVHFVALDANGGIIVADSVGWIEPEDVCLWG
jgi:exosome complex component RRP46